MSFWVLGTAFAQAAETAQRTPQGFAWQDVIILPLVFFAVFYFFAIRPQIKKTRQHQDLLNALKPGDEIVTSGGVIGKVRSVAEGFVSVEIAPGTSVKVLKSHISGTTKSAEKASQTSGVKEPAKA